MNAANVNRFFALRLTRVSHGARGSKRKRRHENSILIRLVATSTKLSRLSILARCYIVIDRAISRSCARGERVIETQEGRDEERERQEEETSREIDGG